MTSKFQKNLFILITILVTIAILFSLSFRIIPTGHTGILVTFGKVSDYTLDAGAHFKWPTQKVILMDNREQPVTLEQYAFTKDTQEAKVVYTISYQIDKKTAMNLYQNIGVGYFQTLISPRLTEALKNSVKSFTADQLIQNRDSIAPMVVEDLRQNLNGYGVTIIGVFIEDLDFSDVYTNAVEAKQVAEQEKLKAAIEQLQRTNEAEQQASRDIINANAEATKAKVAVDAEWYTISKRAAAEADRTRLAVDAEAYAIEARSTAEAEANKKLAESLTKELVSYLEVQKWNGERVMEITGATPLIQIPVE